MGMYSDLCKGCNESIVADFETGPEVIREGVDGYIEEWMSKAVVLTEDGNVLRGFYNGYGRVGVVEDAIGFDNEVWHQACWELAGSPMTFTSASGSDDNQGFWQEELVGKPDPRTTLRGKMQLEQLQAAAAKDKSKAPKTKKSGVGISFFVPGLDSSDPAAVRKALSKLVLNPDKYLV